MTTATKGAKVAFTNKEHGARLEGTFIADTGPTWMVHAGAKGVQVLKKSEWESAVPRTDPLGFNFDDLLLGGRL